MYCNYVDERLSAYLPTNGQFDQYSPITLACSNIKPLELARKSLSRLMEMGKWIWCICLICSPLLSKPMTTRPWETALEIFEHFSRCGRYSLGLSSAARGGDSMPHRCFRSQRNSYPSSAFGFTRGRIYDRCNRDRSSFHPHRTSLHALVNIDCFKV